MKLSIRKIILIICVSIMLASALTGCGDDKEDLGNCAVDCGEMRWDRMTIDYTTYGNITEADCYSQSRDGCTTEWKAY